jgi:hypothetical protein
MCDCEHDHDHEHEGKAWYRSKTIWGGISLFILSVLTIIGSFPEIQNNPRLAGVVGIIFSIFWIIVRAVTDGPITTPTINLPGINWQKSKGS